VTAVGRAALLRKYQVLAKWREAKDLGAGARTSTGTSTPDPDGDAPDRKALRSLAIEFPGALRELDVLGLPEILNRIEQLSRPANLASSHQPTDAWIAWIAAYHALMRAALVAKRAHGRARRLAAKAMPELLDAAGTAAGIPIEASFVRAVVRPPDGRLAIVVLGAMARHFKVPATEISTTLFPPRRPPPYTLPT
jgi:hypothetical protein